MEIILECSSITLVSDFNMSSHASNYANSSHVAIRALRAYPKRIQSVEEAMSLNGVAKKTAEKVTRV